jgi:hypothetical protein
VVQGRHDDLMVVRPSSLDPKWERRQDVLVQPTKTGTTRTVMLKIIIKVFILMGLTTSVVRPDADAIALFRRGSVLDSVEAS